jgi:transposase-like protein
VPKQAVFAFFNYFLENISMFKGQSISLIYQLNAMKFKSLIELFDTFKTEEQCREYLIQQRWNGKPVCPHCGYTEKAYVIENGKRFKCGNKECYKKYSVTVGAFFENSNIELRTLFAAMYLITAHKKGISSLQLSRDLNIHQKTAWFMLHRIRGMVANKKPELLEGYVQVDETFVGGKNKNRHESKKVRGAQGRSAKDKTPVLGAIEVGGKVVANVITDTTKESLQPVINRMVKHGSIMVTDEWQAYRGLGVPYHHIVINHGAGEYVRGAFDTNSMENFWSLFKRGIIGVYHQVSAKHLQAYVDEFAYRHNSRKDNDQFRFSDTLTKTEGRLKYKDLTAKKKGAE